MNIGNNNERFDLYSINSGSPNIAKQNTNLQNLPPAAQETSQKITAAVREALSEFTIGGFITDLKGTKREAENTNSTDSLKKFYVDLSKEIESSEKLYGQLEKNIEMQKSSHKIVKFLSTFPNLFKKDASIQSKETLLKQLDNKISDQKAARGYLDGFLTNAGVDVVVLNSQIEQGQALNLGTTPKELNKAENNLDVKNPDPEMKDTLPAGAGTVEIKKAKADVKESLKLLDKQNFSDRINTTVDLIDRAQSYEEKIQLREQIENFSKEISGDIKELKKLKEDLKENIQKQNDRSRLSKLSNAIPDLLKKDGTIKKKEELLQKINAKIDDLMTDKALIEGFNDLNAMGK